MTDWVLQVMRFARLKRLAGLIGVASSLFLLLALSGNLAREVSAGGSVHYVVAGATDSGDCTDAGHPCGTIQYAVDESAPYGDSILVATGTYTFSTNGCTFFSTPSVVCYINKDLRILGGYSTTNWSTPNPSTNVTVIDGQGKYRGVAVYGGPITSLTMEGFTIQNSRAEGPWTQTDAEGTGYGGGMWVLDAYVTLRDIKFINNQAIGQNNPASGIGGGAAGGGLAINDSPVGTSSLLQRVTFSNNLSQGGTGSIRGGVAFGAMLAVNSAVTVQDSVFTNNSAIGGNSEGSGISQDTNQAYGLGGAIGLENASVNLTRLTIIGNHATGGDAGRQGGGAHGGAIFSENGGSFLLSGSVVSENSLFAGNGITGGWSFGAGISLLNTPATIGRTSIVSNTAKGGNSTGGGYAGGVGGGGVYAYRGVSDALMANLTNVIIADNAISTGTSGTNPGGGGGGVQIQGLSATLTHVTFARNQLGTNLTSGQAILGLSGGIGPATINADYTIVADHTAGGRGASAAFVQSGSTLAFTRGLFAGNTKNTDGTGTISGLSTMLSSSSAGFLSPGSPNYNYHIRLDSAAKDQATGSIVTDDVDGQSRPYNGVSDIGADEYWPFPLSAAATNGAIELDWGTGASLLAGGVSRYEVLVTCPAGANPPDQGSCGQPINAGTATSFTLTGLSNFKSYTSIINARDGSGALVATSTSVTTLPTNILLYLPLILR